jgi:hypothetical protein
MSLIKIGSNGLDTGVGGKVLQVVHGIYGSATNTTSSSYVDTNLSASITPSSTSNKIFIVASLSIGMYPSGVASYPKFIAVRNSTLLTETEKLIMNRDDASRPNYQYGSVVNLNYLDSPSLTSSITYKIQFRNDVSSGGTLYVNPAGGDYANLTLMEISA